MSQRTYNIVAVIGLVGAGFATAWLGPRFAGFLRGLDPSVSGLLGVLGWALAALVAVLGLAVVLWPLRVRAGYPTLGEEVQQLKEGGLEGLVKQAAEESVKARARDPATRRQHHLLMTLVGGLLSAGAILLAWGAWRDGYVIMLVAAAAVVLPGFTLYHLFRAAVPGRPAD